MSAGQAAIAASRVGRQEPVRWQGLKGASSQPNGKASLVPDTPTTIGPPGAPVNPNNKDLPGDFATEIIF
jgi:hypothetical protein